MSSETQSTSPPEGSASAQETTPICTQPTAGSPVLPEDGALEEIIPEPTVCSPLEAHGRRGSGSSNQVTALPGVVFSNDGYGSIGVGPPPQGYTFNAQGQVVQVQYPQVPGGGAVAPQVGVAGGIQYMAPPAPIPGVPAGLEYLSMIDQLLVHQQVEMFELLTTWETSNRYQVKNSIGQQVYFAAEESGSCMRQCCGNSRSFIMHITDNLGKEVIRVVRDFKCCACINCCAFSNCCAMTIRVEAPIGTVIGSVSQQCSIFAPSYAVMDAAGQKVFDIEGPMCFCQTVCCAHDIKFGISSQTGEEVGKICKQWAGLAKEAFTQATNFGVSFPPDLDVNMKAVLLGAVFLIDFMYFEQKNKVKKDK